MSGTMGQVVIVGAGHAGVTAAALLRQQRYSGRIVLLDEQGLLPYHRPILSKAWLGDDRVPEAALLKPHAFYARNEIDLRLSEQVSAIDRSERIVSLARGTQIAYEHLILACGAESRALMLPGLEHEGVFALRTMDEADRIRAALMTHSRIVIVGGGYIGLEVAAAARAKGADVVLVERESRLLARVASPEISAHFAGLHERHGVKVKLGRTLVGIDGPDGRVTGVSLDDGTTLACDGVLIAVGSMPRLGLARACGLECLDGVVVDGSSRSSDPAIFAIGDMTFRPLAHYGHSARLESVGSALEQARQAAWAILGRPGPSPEVPWFWSDQYGAKLRIAGLASVRDSTVVRRGISGGLSVFHLQGDCVQCVEAVDAAQDFAAGKLLIGTRQPVRADMLGDPLVSLKSIVVPSHAEA